MDMLSSVVCILPEFYIKLPFDDVAAGRRSLASVNQVNHPNPKKTTPVFNKNERV